MNVNVLDYIEKNLKNLTYSKILKLVDIYISQQKKELSVLNEDNEQNVQLKTKLTDLEKARVLYSNALSSKMPNINNGVKNKTLEFMLDRMRNYEAVKRKGL